MLWIKAKFYRSRAAVLECVYRPPTTHHAQIQTDYNDVKEQIENLISTFPSKRFLIAGVMNSDFASNPAAYERLKELERFGLRCAVH